MESPGPSLRQSGSSPSYGPPDSDTTASPCCCPTRQEPGTSRTARAPRLRKGPSRVQEPVGCWAGRWACWRGSGRSPLPGVGPLIAAGPIMAALSGAALGATFGGIAGTLIGIGIPEYEAKQYEGKVRDGNILISIHTDDSDEEDLAEKILEKENASDVASAVEA